MIFRARDRAKQAEPSSYRGGWAFYLAGLMIVFAWVCLFNAALQFIGK